MPKVSEEMVYAVKMARWEEWQEMAKHLPRGRHIISVELLRTNLQETAVVLTVVHDGRLVQYELRGDVNGRNARPVVTKQQTPGGCEHHQPGHGDVPPRIAPMAAMAAPPPPPPGGGGDGSPTADSIVIGYPPAKENPQPGAIALGESLLGDTFNLGEHAVDDSSSPPA